MQFSEGTRSYLLLPDKLGQLKKQGRIEGWYDVLDT